MLTMESGDTRSDHGHDGLVVLAQGVHGVARRVFTTPRLQKTSTRHNGDMLALVWRGSA